MSASGLDGILDPLSRCLDAESAQRLIEFEIDPSVQERMAVLAERANEGILTREERSEYESIMHAADMIAILKLKARLLLKAKIH